MNTKQLKAAAASLLLTASMVGVGLIATATQANAWPCVPRCGTPVPSTPAPTGVNPSGPVVATPVTTVGPGGH